MIRAVGQPTVLFAGGGTGGHLFPGVAVAEALARRVPGSRALLAITERDAVSAHGAACPLDKVRVDSPKRPRGAVGVPVFGARMARAITRSLMLLRDERVSAVVGLGGYGSVAPVLAARIAGVPSLLLEQNAVPGQATRMLSRFASLTAGSFPGLAGRGVRNRVEMTGNPVRESVLRLRDAREEMCLLPGVPVIAVLGGSLGAQGVSRGFLEALPVIVARLGRLSAPFPDPGLRPVGPTFQVIHAAGSEAASAELVRAYRKAGIRACVRPFFGDMAAVYGTADAAFCRAGGTTVAELAAVGLPAVFVPYPHHADGHQRENARALVESGAAALIEERDITPEAVADHLVPLLRDAVQRRRWAREARRHGHPQAADRVVELLLQIESARGRSRVARARTARSPVAAGATMGESS